MRRSEGLAFAVARGIRMSPLKVRRVIDMIRDKRYTDALAILNFTPNIAAEPIRKVLESAAANAEHLYQLDRERLYIKACFVDEGPTVKRMHPTTMGRARIIKRRSSHITVQLAEQARLPRARNAG